MARPRTPTEILKVTGAFKRNPNRTRAIGAKSTRGLGGPPAYFAEDEIENWEQIADEAAAGVLTSADRTIVELLARLRAKFRRDWLTGAEMSQMTWCCSRIGLTPSDRSKVSAPDPDHPASPYDEFLQ